MRLVDADVIDKQIGAWIGHPGYGDYYTGYDNALCAIRDLITDMPTLPQPNNEPLMLDGWVSVKDRLPKENKRVLVHVVNASTLDVDTDRIVGGQWVRWAGSITHWMPLPEPPKKEN